jgi:hypothetical protein
MVFLPVERRDAGSIAVKGMAALRPTEDSELILGVRPNEISVVTPASSASEFGPSGFGEDF